MSGADDTYDYVIIGAGSAGCVLANRLSADPAIRVALVEAGPRDDWHWIHIPAGTREVIGNPRTDWCYETEIEPMLGRRTPVARGRVLGGSSSVNGTVYQRGSAADYDQWRQRGLVGWAWDDVLPYFKRSEDFIEGADGDHGQGGELRVEHPRLHFDVFDIFTRAAEQAGVPRRADFNRGALEGCGMWDVKQRRGRRVSAATAFLAPVRRRGNLDILTDATCTGLTFDGARATGANFDRKGYAFTLTARRETLVCAGAIGSPQLLQLSGIGPGDILRDAGVEVRLDRPSVGANLHDHVTMRVAQKVHGVKTLNTMYHNPVSKTAIALQYALSGSGPLVMGAPLWGGYTRSDQQREVPNLQFLLMPVSMSVSFSAPDRFDAISGGIYNLHPRSRGRVWIRSKDFRKPPSILHNFLTDADDQRVAIDSLRLMRRIFSTPAFKALQPEELRPGSANETDEELLAAGLETAGTAYHQVGTCEMSADGRGVVDGRLRVRGLQGLRVVDGSVMPAIVSGSTGTAIMMIAEKAADMIRADARSST